MYKGCKMGEKLRFSAVLVFAFILPVRAAFIWNNSTHDNMWSNPANWTGGIPDTSTYTYIDLSGTDKCVVSSVYTASARHIWVGSAASISGFGEEETRGAAIQLVPGEWDGFMWCTAMPDEAEEVTFYFNAGGSWESVVDSGYPFEHSVTVSDSGTPLQFYIEVLAADSNTYTSPTLTIGAMSVP